MLLLPCLPLTVLVAELLVESVLVAELLVESLAVLVAELLVESPGKPTDAVHSTGIAPGGIS
jgi:hypothetical protein